MAFGKKITEKTMANYQESTNSVNTIVNGTEINGEIKSTGDIRIDGKLKGTVDIKGRLVIGATGFVDGEIICSNCDVSGKILGTITVTELLSLKSSANIQGDMVTKKLSIEPGAVFTGTCKMDGKQGQGTQNFTPKTEQKEKITSK